MNFGGEGKRRMTAWEAIEQERFLIEARASTARTIQLLSAAERYEALPYLRQALALIGNRRVERGPRNRTTLFLLRMAVVLLDRDGENEAAGDVESALAKLGEPFPELTESEANARIAWRLERRAMDDSQALGREG